jgi:hypothetical protein
MNSSCAGARETTPAQSDLRGGVIPFSVRTALRWRTNANSVGGNPHIRINRGSSAFADSNARWCANLFANGSESRECCAFSQCFRGFLCVGAIWVLSDAEIAHHHQHTPPTENFHTSGFFDTR